MCKAKWFKVSANKTDIVTNWTLSNQGFMYIWYAALLTKVKKFIEPYLRKHNYKSKTDEMEIPQEA